MHPDEAYYAALGRLIRPTRAVAYPKTLAPMRALLRALGEPQERLRAVVVGGSVGKGTTAAFLAQMLRASGARVGCYSGPHLHSWRERFTINGARISPTEFTALVKRVHETISENDFALRKFAPPGLHENDFAHSTFEMNTALALSWFAERAVDFVVLEAGIGGRWDAVNAAARAAPSALAILTPIEREHANLLGGSLTSIAAHKAGLIPTGGWAISAPQTPAVAAILREEAEQRGAALVFVGDVDEEPFALARALAEEAFRILCPTQPMPEAGLIPPPGRYEWLEHLGHRWLLDGGHTPRAGRELARVLAREAPAPKRALLVLAMLRDKDAAAFTAPLDEIRHRFLLTTTPGNRALLPRELRARASIQRAQVSLVAEPAEAIRRALETSSELLVVTGSLRLVAIAREELGLVPDALREEAQLTRALLAGEWKP